jgi:hypothetical protein
MKLVAGPGVFNVIFLLKLIDKALADITEGSDIIGENLDIDAHVSLL